SAPVVVTTATTTANPAPGVPLAQTTYYATQITPAVVSQTGTNYPVQQSMVQTTPYPVGNQTMPMPQNQGFNQQPPSYDQVQSNANMYT
uniref:Uncharacterized protein n=1 Tax=Megaselia scalaris TaxID=36166 RepID=T1H3C9_MEGSC